MHTENTFTNSHTQILAPFSVLLGITDSVVETVFRTSEGFVTNWLNTEHNDASNTAVEDCVIRNPGGGWGDAECHVLWNFYCEG